MDSFDPRKWPKFVWFPSFVRDWERLGLDAEDLRSLENEILKDPSRSPVIKGTGGLRKLRFSGRKSTRGKSGGDPRLLRPCTGIRDDRLGRRLWQEREG